MAQGTETGNGKLNSKKVAAAIAVLAAIVLIVCIAVFGPQLGSQEESSSQQTQDVPTYASSTSNTTSTSNTVSSD